MLTRSTEEFGWLIVHDAIEAFLENLILSMGNAAHQEALFEMIPSIAKYGKLTLEQFEPVIENYFAFIANSLEQNDESIARACKGLSLFLGSASEPNVEYFIEHFSSISALISRMVGSLEIREQGLNLFATYFQMEANQQIWYLLLEQSQFLNVAKETLCQTEHLFMLVQCYALLLQASTLNFRNNEQILRSDVFPLIVQHTKSNLSCLAWSFQELAVKFIVGVLETAGEPHIGILVELGMIEALCETVSTAIEEALVANAFEKVLDLGKTLIGGDKVVFNPVALRMAEWGILNISVPYVIQDLLDDYLGAIYQQYLAGTPG